MRIALIGYRGSGKSTAGRLLADRLGLPFVDADQALEAKLGRSIASVFAHEGESAFRDWEQQTLAELAAEPKLVLATGGGVVLRPANRQALRQFDAVVWLRADVASLVDRLKKGPGNRPALTEAGLFNEVALVLEARRAFYQESANVIIDTDGKPPEAVAEAVFQALDLEGKRP